MARPKLKCRVEKISFRLSLREGRDDDLIQFFESIPGNKRAAAVTAALRSGGVTLEQTSGGVFSDEEADALLDALDDMEL